MSGSMSDLEKDIEESRARLDRTIDQLQDRLSPTNLVDEMLGSARRSPAAAGLYDEALTAVRRNPLPVLLIAAGVGMLLGRMSWRAPSGGAAPNGRADALPREPETPSRGDAPRGLPQADAADVAAALKR